MPRTALPQRRVWGVVDEAVVALDARDQVGLRLPARPRLLNLIVCPLEALDSLSWDCLTVFWSRRAALTHERLVWISREHAMKRLLTLVCMVGLAAGCPRSVEAQIGSSPTLQDARAEYLKATKAYLRFLEEREAMRSKLRAKRVASDDEIDFWRFQVAVCRTNLAHLNDDPAEAREQYRVAVAVRQGQHDRLTRLRERGGGYDAEMDVAGRQLASARYRSAREEGNDEEAVRQLERIQEIAEKELQRERGLLGRTAATQTEVEDTTYRLIKARHLRALLKGQKDENMQRIRDMAALTESALARLRQLEVRGASSEEEVEWARFRDLHARQRLANAEGKSRRVQEVQDQLASLTAQMLRHALRSSHGTEEETEYLRWEVALQQYRLAQARHGILPEYENIWELDGWTHIAHQPRG
jgi:hypothetical protein